MRELKDVALTDLRVLPGYRDYDLKRPPAVLWFTAPLASTAWCHQSIVSRIAARDGDRDRPAAANAAPRP